MLTVSARVRRLVQILEEIVPGKYDFVHVPHEQQTGLPGCSDGAGSPNQKTSL